MTIILNGTTGITTPGITNQGVVEFTAGSVSAPSITTTSDTNTGIYFPAADTIAFTEGGVESMRIDSSGNVGIGTASPSYKLDVSSSSGSLFRLVRGSVSYGAFLGATESFIGNFSNNALAFTTNDTERMRLDTSGNLGLGVTPSAWGLGKAIQISGSTGFLGFSGLNGNIVTNTYYDGSNYRYIANGFASYQEQSAGAYAWYTAPTGSAGNAVTFTQAMKLSAIGQLEVFATSGNGGRIDVFSNAQTSNQITLAQGFALSTDNIGYLYNRANAAFVFGTNNTERMRITSAGLVGIATTSPGVDLEIGSNTSTTRVLSVRYSSVPLYLSGGYDGGNALSTFSTNSYNTSNGSATWSAFSNTSYGNSAVQLASFVGGADIRFFTASASNTNPSERARFNTTGAFVFAGGTTTADGIGITFPATQSASSNANTLDDYEEGTFDPTFTCNTTAPTGVTYTSRSGIYTKIGRVVYVQLAIALSNKGTGGTGFAVIGNLPFTTASDNPYANFGAMIDALASDLRQVSVQLYPGQPYAYLIKGGGSTGGHDGMAFADITNSTQIRVGFFYII